MNDSVPLAEYLHMVPLLHARSLLMPGRTHASVAEQRGLSVRRHRSENPLRLKNREFVAASLDVRCSRGRAVATLTQIQSCLAS